MLVQITGTYQEETVVNEYTFLAYMFFFSVLNNLQANYLLIVYVSPSHSLMRATS